MNENKMTELNKALEGLWDSLTDEQKAKAKECGSMDELMALAGRAGIELPDELMEGVAGGYVVSFWKDRVQGRPELGGTTLFAAIDDSTGKVLGNAYESHLMAENVAANNGSSTMLISQDRANSIRANSGIQTNIADAFDCTGRRKDGLC